MSQSAYNSLALHEILLSIADSLNEAQTHLRNMPPYDEYGRPNTLYQLPYLDFNLEVISQFESVETSTPNSNTSKALIPSTDKLAYASKETFAQTTAVNAIRFLPYRSTETVTKESGSITSTISGRFVAIMPNEGLPQIALSCTAALLEAGTLSVDYRLTVAVIRPGNEPVVGQRIELNFDELTSSELNQQATISPPIFLSDKDGYSNASGIFTVDVRLNLNDYDNGNTYVFVTNSANQFSSVAISKN